MSLSTAPHPPETSARKWLTGLSRSGGAPALLAVVLPLLAGILLLVQAGVLSGLLHASIIEGRSLVSLAGEVVAFAAVLVVRGLLGFAGEVAAARSSEATKQRLRGAMVRNILSRLPIWTAARSGGALSSVVIEQIEAMDGYLTRYVPAMVQATLLPLVFMVAILPVDWMVALLFLVTAPLIPVFMALAGLGAEAASRRQATALSRLSGHFADRLRGLTTLKLFGREAAETEGVRVASEALRERTMRVMRIAFLSSAVLEFFAALGVAGVALYVGLTFLDLVSLRGAPLSLEAGLFCLLMAPEVYQPLRQLAAHYHDRAAAKAAVVEVARQLGELPTDRSAPATPRTPIATDRLPTALVISKLNVTTPDGRSVIIDADLVVAPGEHVAILGQSGAGKSTLLEAIAGLRPFVGSIVLDDRPLEAIDPAQLRAEVAVLGQRPTAFAGSIANNICLGRRDACHTAVRIAAQRAGVMDFARELPEGLDTQLGENGVGLSGGEVQRMALARLYLRDPGLLLLDEPTAHLDAATEARVLDALLDFARRRTVVVVTHSEAVAARMDRCFRIVQGRLLTTPRPKVHPQASAERGAA